MSYSDLTIYRTLLRRLRPYGLHIFAIFLLGLLATPLTLLGPLPLALAVDSVIGEKPPPAFLAPFLPSSPSGTDEPLLLIAAGLIVIVALLSNLQTLASSFLGAYAGERLVLDFRTQLFSHVQRLSLSYHDSKSTADSIYRIQNDGSAIRYIAIDGLIPFITSTLTFVSMLYISFRLDWQLALVALAVSPILFVVIRTYRLQLRNQSRKLKVLESDTMSVVQEVLTAVRVVKAFGQEDREKDRFVNHARAGMHARIQVSLAEGFLSLLLGLVIAIGTATVLFVGVRNVQSSKLSLGELLLVMAYVSQLYRPLKTMSKQVSNLQAHMASAERALSILHESPDVIERAGARSVSRANGDIVFQNVCFAYDERFRVLHDFSFEVSRSTRVGIIGETGIGKTTLLNLITRFHDPTAGRILLDGVDLRDYKLSALRRQFAIVLQDPVLFSSSIAENIAYANPKASENEITEAARAANAHEFVMGLPNGYETEVGERGIRLSGGERQRIALARAFLKDAPILLLDEPTSSIDPGTEGIILQALERLVDGRTCFIVAHRPHTLVNCDLVLEVKSRQVDNAGSVRTITVIQPVTPSKLMKSIPEVKVST